MSEYYVEKFIKWAKETGDNLLVFFEKVDEVNDEETRYRIVNITFKGVSVDSVEDVVLDDKYLQVGIDYDIETLFEDCFENGIYHMGMNTDDMGI